MTEYAIKVRRAGAKTFAFLTPGGGTNSLRVHAARFKGKDAAQLTADKSAPDNPGTEWKVVPL